jgi:hypothetical protein
MLAERRWYHSLVTCHAPIIPTRVSIESRSECFTPLGQMCIAMAMSFCQIERLPQRASEPVGKVVRLSLRHPPLLRHDDGNGPFSHLSAVRTLMSQVVRKGPMAT